MDRNLLVVGSLVMLGGSLSARRAWIEIKYVVKDSDFSGSLSARRAWIEITRYISSHKSRNCRSPQGERG